MGLPKGDDTGGDNLRSAGLVSRLALSQTGMQFTHRFEMSVLYFQTLAFFVYALESVAFIGFLFTRPHWTLVLSSFGIIAAGFVFFSLLSKCGKKIAKS